MGLASLASRFESYLETQLRSQVYSWYGSYTRCEIYLLMGGQYGQEVCLFVLGFYTVATVFQSYNGGQLS